MPFPCLWRKNDGNDKSRLERKLVVAREIPEPVFDLSECNLRVIPSGVFSLCKVLRKDAIFLQNNCLSSLQGGGDLSDLSNLKFLDLHSNKFSKLPDSIGNLSNLHVLNLNDNQLNSLPDSIGCLINLQQLLIANNKLKSLPKSLSQCHQLMELDVRGNAQLTRLPAELGCLFRLQSLQFDSSVEFPPQELHNQSPDSILRFLATECGATAGAHITTPLPNQAISTSEHFLLQERLRQIEEQKDWQKRQRIDLEKSLMEENLREQEAYQQSKFKQVKLVEDIRLMQCDIDEELSKIQGRRDADRTHLIEEFLLVEENIEKKVTNLLANAKLFQNKMAAISGEQVKLEEQLLFDLHSTAKSLEEEKVMDIMNTLINEEILKAEKWKTYENQRQEDVSSRITQESEAAFRLAELVSKSRHDSQKLSEALLCDQELQKAAVTSLLEESDAKSWQLNQEVCLLQKQLAELSRLEMNKRKLQLDNQIVELSKTRIALTELLMDVFEQKERRRQEMLRVVTQMEKESSGDSFWLQQYELLLKSSSRKLVESFRSVHPDLNQELLTYGVAHFLPLIAHLLQSEDALKDITVETLSKVGVEDADDRCLILKAIEAFLTATSRPHPSAPLNEEEPSAPPLPLSIETVLTRASDECVICLDHSANILFTPCGHICCCGNCSGLSTCPLCRAPIKKLLHLAF